MATFERFPAILRPEELTLFLRPMVKMGPVRVDGHQQRVVSEAGHWVARMKFDLFGPDQVREYRGFVAKLAGGVTEILVPAYDRQQAPWPTGYDYTSQKSQQQLAGGRVFSSGAAPAQRVISVQLNLAADAGATRLRVSILRSGTLRRGHYFSLTDASGRPRLYVITEPPRAISTGVQEIRINPNLRAQAPEAAYLNFDNPECVMTLAEIDGGELTLRPWNNANPELSLRESFNGL